MARLSDVDPDTAPESLVESADVLSTRNRATTLNQSKGCQLQH
jgi:hypothetical protein